MNHQPIELYKRVIPTRVMVPVEGTINNYETHPKFDTLEAANLIIHAYI
jgi:hypothetical protein